MSIRLGVNIDHFITIRRLRDTVYPKTTEVLKAVVAGGADQITLHIREDRRHAREEDLQECLQQSGLPVNLEMAVDRQMVVIAQKFRPQWVCLVPEKREERTTEGGLELRNNQLESVVKELQASRCKVSLFVEPDLETIRHAQKVGADAVELHTGKYALLFEPSEMARLTAAACLAHQLGLSVHAGHGMDYGTMDHYLRIPYLQEVNIGHSIVARALMVGAEQAVREMKGLLR